MNMLRPLLDMRYTLVFAVLAGVMIAPVGQTWWHSVQSYYDDAKPVVVMSGEVVKRDADAVYLHIKGDKLRSCQYMRLQAFAKLRNGSLSDAYIRREGQLERGDTKPLGRFDIGIWRVWPVDDAVGVVVYVQHSCDGRMVLTQVADVRL